mmetsp:Transcript_21415/g.55102  ORF Transcript_21415/g.55102 Transcript_21415/m.55102 type:complete len:247 (-) Transcript_21415:132-872(-)
MIEVGLGLDQLIGRNLRVRRIRVHLDADLVQLIRGDLEAELDLYGLRSRDLGQIDQLLLLDSRRAAHNGEELLEHVLALHFALEVEDALVLLGLLPLLLRLHHLSPFGELLGDERVVPVLHRVLGAAGQHLGDLGPLVAHPPLRVEEHPVLLGGPVALFDGRVEVIEPAFAALLARAARDPRRDHRPLLGAVLSHEVAKQLVLLWQPRSLHHIILNHHPTRLALVRGPVAAREHVGRDRDPVGAIS